MASEGGDCLPTGVEGLGADRTKGGVRTFPLSKVLGVSVAVLRGIRGWIGRQEARGTGCGIGMGYLTFHRARHGTGMGLVRPNRYAIVAVVVQKWVSARTGGCRTEVRKTVSV
jgi:hypothetical protein